MEIRSAFASDDRVVLNPPPPPLSNTESLYDLRTSATLGFPVVLDAQRTKLNSWNEMTLKVAKAGVRRIILTCETGP